jgi:hypothetical protein
MLVTAAHHRKVKIARYGRQEDHMENPDNGTERHHMENPHKGTERHHMENPDDAPQKRSKRKQKIEAKESSATKRGRNELRYSHLERR